MKRIVLVLIAIFLIVTSLLFLENQKIKNEVEILKSTNERLQNEINEIKDARSNDENVEITLEMRLFQLLNNEHMSDKERDLVYVLLSEVDIRNFDNICADKDSEFNYEIAISWAFEHMDISNQKNMHRLIRLYSYLDGVYSEGYSYYIRKLYEENRVAFIKTMDRSSLYAKGIFSSIAYDLHEEEKLRNEKERLANFLNTEDFNLKEQALIKEFMKVLDNHIGDGF